MKELQFFTEKVLGSPGEGLFSEAFKEYQSYIDSNKPKLPDTVVNIVKSDWYFNARDSRCPKDAWLIKQRIENEFSTTEREKKPAEYEITLLGAYHDCHLHFGGCSIFCVSQVFIGRCDHPVGACNRFCVTAR